MKDDSTREFRLAADALVSSVDEWQGDAKLRMGMAIKRLSRYRAGRFLVTGIASRFLAFLAVNLKMFGIEPGECGDAAGLTMNYLRIPTAFRMTFEILYAGPDRVEIAFPVCVIGYSDGSCAGACRTATSIDERIVEKLGGRLEVARSIPEGAPACTFVITRPGGERR